jgi:hypothetical protein
MRCLAVVCLMVSELPPAADSTQPNPAVSTNELLREHVVAAIMDHLQPAPTEAGISPARGPEPHGAVGAVGGARQAQPGAAGQILAVPQANLARMLHRCIAGSLRSYVAEGLKVTVPQLAPARHAANALAWLRCMMRHPAMRQQALLER